VNPVELSCPDRGWLTGPESVAAQGDPFIPRCIPLAISTKRLAGLIAATFGAGDVHAIETLSFSASKDAAIYNNATSNANGAGVSFLAGNNGSGQTRRGLIRFDLSSIVPGSTVESVRLELYMDQSPNATARAISLHPILESWTEGSTDPGGLQGQGTAGSAGDVTWSSRSLPSLAWTTPGGTFGSASASASVTGVGWYAWEATSSMNVAMLEDIQNWIDAPATNAGWMIVGVEPGTSTVKRFVSSEGDPAFAPKLTLTVVPVPEPETYALFAAGLVLLGVAARRRPRTSV
jgi:hypothetical protein